MSKFFFSSCLTVFTALFFCSCEKVICLPGKGELPVIPPSISTWTAIPSPTTNTLLDVRFVNANLGFISGASGTLLKTTDGGATWNIMNTNVSTSLRSICMLNASKGFAVGDLGVILKTTDGGVTWEKTTVAGTPTLNKVYFVDDNTGFIGGLAGTFFRTTDGGTTWNSVASGSTSSIYNIYFVDSDTGYICGQAGYIGKSTNGGTNWTPQSSGVGANPSDLLLNIKFTDAKHGFVIGEKINDPIVHETYILHTTDGGANWRRGTCPYNNIAMTGLEVVNDSTAYAVGGYIATNTYYILKTTDGQNWNVESTGSNRLVSIFLMNQSSGFSVGLNGQILKGN